MKLNLLYYPKLSFLIGCCMLLSACGVTSKLKGEPDKMYSVYEKSLTESEKAKLEQKGTLIKGITLYDNRGNEVERGKLLVQKQGSKYNFVEIGDWHVIFPEQSGIDQKVGIYQVDRMFDQKGNMIAQDVFVQGKSDSLIRVEKMTSTLDTLDQKAVLVQNWEMYDSNSSLTETFSQISPEFENILSDRFKPKYKHGKHITYNPNGKIKSTQSYDFRDRVKAR
ncbi:hypothetical protein QNI19_33175 [Cytophagaceae bacterium DM2B3-1]|uniref:Lipoprotein n=1 Tax=Xanthocytophaga flava TaxID=3048013 RepID=A0ABT7CY00_9BACT|nr:hypothetical protein [Xanthocytophaga flavus]MDJ1497840.1 hypothetical protein [Xanthocytophaga flavus]